jgi:hypothetical protein
MGNFGGTKHNLIRDDVHLQITVRGYKEELRQRILASLDRIAKGIALAGGVPADHAPIVKVSDTEVPDSTYNDPVLTTRVAAAIGRALGPENVKQLKREMGCEDFGLFGLSGHDIPTMMFRIGAIDVERMERARSTGVPLPSVHSSLFWPVPGPTIRTGVIAMSAAVLDLMSRAAQSPAAAGNWGPAPPCLGRHIWPGPGWCWRGDAGGPRGLPGGSRTRLLAASLGGFVHEGGGGPAAHGARTLAPGERPLRASCPARRAAAPGVRWRSGRNRRYRAAPECEHERGPG